MAELQKHYTKIKTDKGNIPIKVPIIGLSCKYCGSKNVIRYGRYRGVQRLFCNDCKRKFADNEALPHMQTPIEQVGSAISMYFEGTSLNSVTRLHSEIYDNYPSDSSIYRWIARFSKEANKGLKKYKPQVGDTWVADETVLKIGGRNMWLLDIIDSDTRFLLATKLSSNRNMNDIRQLMESASDRAGKTPKTVLTDGWGGYLDGIEMAFGADAKHIQTNPFGDSSDSTTLIERWHGTLKDRTKVMRGLKDKSTADLILDGYLLHYNYFRPHESLDGKTPAEEAKVKYPYKNWTDLVKSHLPHKSSKGIYPIVTKKKIASSVRKLASKPLKVLKAKRLKSHKTKKSKDDDSMFTYLGHGIVTDLGRVKL